MSHDAREKYGKVQKEIARIVGKASTGKVTKEDYEDVRLAEHNLRKQLTNDLTSRKQARVGDETS